MDIGNVDSASSSDKSEIKNTVIRHVGQNYAKGL
jgi:hypothetical protein